MPPSTALQATADLSPMVIDGYLQFLNRYGSDLVKLTVEHLQITAYTIAIAVPLGVLVGVFITFFERLAPPVLWVASIMQTVPSIALFGILIPFLGIGTPPVVVALVLYSQLPIIRNTYIGITEIDPSAVEAGEGLGMSTVQRMRRIQLPMAMPVIMAGVRNAVVMLIGIAAIGAFIGAGGLGDFLFQGIRKRDVEMIVVTTAVLSALALAIDYGFAVSEQLLRIRNGEEIEPGRPTKFLQKVLA
ncbi:ABC transporter permease [Halorarius halobius]|uniref:ABC transporter permease n=1 Tax=Halorarius halobius TaxID=2962671 RepID=UPI0020CE8DCB|nr:ABC transporter permease [Halorarius halobius]